MMRGGSVRRIAGAVAALILVCMTSRGATAPQGIRGATYQAVFTQYSPLFGNAEILRRMLSPLAAQAVRDSLARSLEALTPYSVDLTKEKFLVYVPSGAPPSPRGFALLVFVSPWNQPRFPIGWASQLEHYGVIFVSAVNAGNNAAVLSRRVPLALAAEENIVREYPVDRQRIFIGGLSGGSRVAMRVALGYPDVFHGAILNAGADPLGGSVPLPPRGLFRRFQSESHLLYFTGERDTVHLAKDAGSLQSMREWCVFDVETYEIPDEGHELMSSRALGRALDRLLSGGRSPDPARLTACRSRHDAELDAKLESARTLVASGNHTAARKLLQEIDEQYGGLAAPRILDLARRCGCGPGQAGQPGEPGKSGESGP
jgi:pimeloyl-ACP methyl ester carboxylesterase